MKQWNKNELEELKKAMPIGEVAYRLGIPVMRGRAKCWQPENHAHGDRTPSVSFSNERGSFRCFVCDNLKGDSISLIQSKLGLSFPQAVEWLREQTGVVTISKSDFKQSVPKSKPLPKVEKKLPSLSEENHLTPVLSNEQKLEILSGFHKLLKPIDGAVLKYLKKRKIFQKTWDSLGLRCIADYHEVSEGLKKQFPMAQLQAIGLYNQNEHLRYFKHPLIFPYYNSKKQMAYFQARSIEVDMHPKFMNLPGRIPFPYNARVLDKNPGVVFLCESVTDVMTLVEKGFPAVGIAGVSSFKEKWAPMFVHKKVILTFDADKAGREGAENVSEIFAKFGITTSKMDLPEGMDVNEYFSS